MIFPIRGTDEVDIRYQFQPALTECFSQLHERLCLDSHCCYLARFTAFIILDLTDNWLIQIFFNVDCMIASECEPHDVCLPLLSRGLAVRSSHSNALS